MRRGRDPVVLAPTLWLFCWPASSHPRLALFDKIAARWCPRSTLS